MTLAYYLANLKNENPRAQGVNFREKFIVDSYVGAYTGGEEAHCLRPRGHPHCRQADTGRGKVKEGRYREKVKCKLSGKTCLKRRGFKRRANVHF